MVQAGLVMSNLAGQVGLVRLWSSGWAGQVRVISLGWSGLNIGHTLSAASHWASPLAL